ncbi:hypothetical protein MJO28_010664 [Puccinia striiformis f. sp. tritici]|uniref:Uncharacterized protein n=1 Tax=Puccinia striiformis f. sp. tritici TaxID=168172 RepID=A0ACC0E538_9BASI|nr:hypothetical protein MJO28_010664 [Puccinia striiformis f. sp. tritici]
MSRITDYIAELEEEDLILDLLNSDSSPPERRTTNGLKAIILRERVEGHKRLIQDYFAANPVYPNHLFERRFRMSKGIFDCLCQDLQTHDRFWVLKSDCCGQVGLSPHQKITAAIRLLAYGTSADSVDEYVQLGETTSLRTLKYFTNHIIQIYGAEYLRTPNSEELKVILQENEEQGFPGCIGSIDGMHWAWKNCPTGWAGQYKGKEKSPTIVLEAVASKNLRIWHSFFGSPGALNDINILHRSHLFDRLLAGAEDHICYTINGREYNTGYYLADGIYPPWSTLVRSIKHPQDPASKHFAKLQELVQKDIERTFGVLQARWHILTTGCRLWEKEDVKRIMTCCIILHNMIVEDRSPNDLFISNAPASAQIITNHLDPTVTNTISRYLQRTMDLHNCVIHAQLQQDLKAYNWHLRGETEE